MSHYNESEKILLLHQYVTSGLTLQEFSSRLGIPLSTFHRIYTEYGSPDVSSLADLMKKEDIPGTGKATLLCPLWPSRICSCWPQHDCPL